ncbi:DMT family transporter [Streptomyces sp. N35]|uniref:DMT family transporter n=1 Tax=Streptomyces sp. N35 TaxID=2795730 RepID=UPI0018F34BCE|nr:DMT family transporter [Streptomyces sp. N35]
MAVLDRVRTPEATATPTKPKGRAAGTATLGLLLALVATVVWSGSFIGARALADTVPPIQHAYWRWTLALTAAAPFAARHAWRERHIIVKHWRFVGLASLLGITVYNTLVYQAGISTSAGNMGMIMAASPVVMTVYEKLGGARLGARRVAGMLIACVGVLLLVSKGKLSPDFAPGDLWMLAAALSFASYSALLRRRPAELGGLAFLFTSFALGAVILSPAFVASLVLQGGFTPTVGSVSPLLYAGVFSSAIAFFTWNKAISLIGAGRAGLVYYLQPVFVAILSYVILGEPTGPMQILCMVLILGGVVLGSVGRSVTGAKDGRTVTARK